MEPRTQYNDKECDRGKHVLDHYVGPESLKYVAVCLVCGIRYTRNQMLEYVNKGACVLATPDFIGNICKQSEEQTILIDSPIPPDAKFIGAEYSFERRAFLVAFEHDSFDDIQEGRVMPILECPKFTLTHNLKD